MDLAAKLVQFMAERIVNLLGSMVVSRERGPDANIGGRALVDVHCVYEGNWANVGRWHLAHKDF